MPFVHHRRTRRAAAAGAHGERDAAVTEADGGLGFFFRDGEKVAPSPEVMALALDELTGCLPRLPPELRLLIAVAGDHDDRLHHLAQSKSRYIESNTQIDTLLGHVWNQVTGLDRPRSFHQRLHRRRAESPFVRDRLTKPQREVRLELKGIEEALVLRVDRRRPEIQLALVDRVRENILGRLRVVEADSQQVYPVDLGAFLQPVAKNLDIVRSRKAAVRVLELLNHEATIQHDGVPRREGHL